VKKLTHALDRHNSYLATQTVVRRTTPIANLTSELTGITALPAYRTVHAPSSQPRGAREADWRI
jgi:hypothetical protein